MDRISLQKAWALLRATGE